MVAWLRGLLGGGTGSTTVSAAETHKLLSSGALLLDVRSKAERQTLWVPGSKHLPVEQLAGQLDSLPMDQVIVCQCASGHRSGIAARQLKTQGYDARNLSGGITAWKSAGLPVKQG
ncbi:rhodanese-like domain-containing protein [Deinococcus detaillensis]|uniref:Rhodanese-like domain-containing protein n=1 Tax=Deinococcus detaillensis TaxID=2592048 RepID=A0A553UZ25_9DEIO|nr:rhodanese-like domain-containing protein [Deinococcus detaillensis]TSA85469.1 rhodanese-like domain-containing protein [Deinococcus detaillensis]